MADRGRVSAEREKIVCAKGVKSGDNIVAP